MWRFIKRWRDWAMDNFWPLSRVNPQLQALYFSYEKAGLVVPDQPVPWNAEAVLVEALLRLPPPSRRRADYALKLPKREPIAPDQFRKLDADDRYRITFRLPPPGESVTAELLFRDHTTGSLSLPFLSRDQFLHDLGLQKPTLFVRLGQETVACQTFVSSQCRGLLASAVIVSSTSLVPLLDLDLQVEFRSERSKSALRVPACLCSTQLAGKQALVTVVPTRHPRRMGSWEATWLLGDQPIITQKVRGISQKQFQRSLRVSDTRFVSQPKCGGMFQLVRHMPSLDNAGRVGPCFLVSSSEPGMAGLCKLRVAAQVFESIQPPLLQEQEVLITDGPKMVAPGTLDAHDLAQVSGFEISVGRHVLGVLSLCPAPTATFTGEGGYKPPHDFVWTTAAEEEMNERLNRLLEQRSAKDN